MMSKTEICRRLHDMVDELHDLDDLAWDGAYPMIRIGLQAKDGNEAFTLVVGVEPGNDG